MKLTCLSVEAGSLRDGEEQSGTNGIQAKRVARQNTNSSVLQKKHCDAKKGKGESKREGLLLGETLVTIGIKGLSLRRLMGEKNY